MPHIAVTMIPGRDDATKKRMAERLQSFLAGELGIDENLVSVSVQDIPMDNWREEMGKIPMELMFVPPES